MRAADNVRRNIDHIKRQMEETAKKVQAEKEVKERNLAVSKEKDEAILWLLERGKKIGVDFSADDAIQCADGIAFDEEIARQIANLGEDEGISFSGDDNCENCSGWDGSSRRCDCGNRRVGWERGYGHSFKTPSIYAEAY